MIVELADLKKALDLLAEINKAPLASIEWREPVRCLNPLKKRLTSRPAMLSRMLD